MRARRKTVLKFLLNIVFAVYHCVLGILSHSVWFLALGVYYIVLSVLRIGVVRFSGKGRKSERFVMRFSGILMLGLALVLSTIVYMTVMHDVAARYHEIVMITLALYAFTKITLAIRGAVKAGKVHAPHMQTLQSISVADAVVSIYSLQRSMLVSFEGMAPKDIALMNTLSGIGMCIIVFSIGIYLIRGKVKKNGKIESCKENR